MYPLFPPSFLKNGQVISYRKIGLILVLLIFLGLPSHSLAKKGIERPHYIVQLAPLNRDELVKFGLTVQHPYQADLNVIQNSMDRLAYQTRKLTWSKKKKLFSRGVINRLSPLIQSKLAQADNSKKVVFKLKDQEGNTLLMGDTFLTRDGLNWRFTVLGDKERKLNNLSLFGSSWRLATLSGQSYKKTKWLFFFNRSITNWIVADKGSRSKSINLESPAQDSQNESPSATREDRLKQLQELLDEELITEEEYQEKVKQINGNT